MEIKNESINVPFLKAKYVMIDENYDYVASSLEYNKNMKALSEEE